MIIFSIQLGNFFYSCHLHDEAESYLTDHHPFWFRELNPTAQYLNDEIQAVYQALLNRIKTKRLVGLEIKPEELIKHITQGHVYYELILMTQSYVIQPEKSHKTELFAIHHQITSKGRDVLYSVYLNEGMNAVLKILHKLGRGESIDFEIRKKWTLTSSGESLQPLLQLEPWACHKITSVIKQNYRFSPPPRLSSYSQNTQTWGTLLLLGLFTTAGAHNTTAQFQSNDRSPLGPLSLLPILNSPLTSFVNNAPITVNRKVLPDIFRPHVTISGIDLDKLLDNLTASPPTLLIHYNFGETNPISLLELGIEFILKHTDAITTDNSENFNQEPPRLQIAIHYNDFTRTHHLTIVEYQPAPILSTLKPLADISWKELRRRPTLLQRVQAILNTYTTNIVYKNQVYYGSLISPNNQTLTNHELIHYLNYIDNSKSQNGHLSSLLRKNTTMAVSHEDMRLVLSLYPNNLVLLMEELKIASRQDDLDTISLTVKNLSKMGFVNSDILIADILTCAIKQEISEQKLNEWLKHEAIIEQLHLFSFRGKMAKLTYKMLSSRLQSDNILADHSKAELLKALGNRSHDPILNQLKTRINTSLGNKPHSETENIDSTFFTLKNMAIILAIFLVPPFLFYFIKIAYDRFTIKTTFKARIKMPDQKNEDQPQPTIKNSIAKPITFFKNTTENSEETLQTRLDELTQQLDNIEKKLKEFKFENFITDKRKELTNLENGSIDNTQHTLMRQLEKFTAKISHANGVYLELENGISTLKNSKPTTLTSYFIDTFQIQIESNTSLLRSILKLPSHFEELMSNIEKTKENEQAKKNKPKFSLPQSSEKKIKKSQNKSSLTVSSTPARAPTTTQIQTTPIQPKKTPAYARPSKITLYLHDVSTNCGKDHPNSFYICAYNLVRVVECLITYKEPGINIHSFKQLRMTLKQLYLLEEPNLLLTFCLKFSHSYKNPDWNWANEPLILTLRKIKVQEETQNPQWHINAFVSHANSLAIIYQSQLENQIIHILEDQDARSLRSRTQCHIMYLDSCLKHLKKQHFRIAGKEAVNIAISINIIRNYIWHENERSVSVDEIWQVISNANFLQNIKFFFNPPAEPILLSKLSI